MLPRMDEPNQTPTEHPRAIEPPPALYSLDSPIGDEPLAPIPSPHVPSTRVALLSWLAILVVFGAGGLLMGQQELALLAALAGVFVAANVADVDPQWRELYYALGWVVPGMGFAGGILLGVDLWRSQLPLAARSLLVMLSACAAGLSVLSVATPVADRIARRWLHAERPGHLLRLTARAVLLTFALAIPGWFASQTVLEELLRDPTPLLERAGLGGGLIGYVMLAFAGVGLLVRRNLSESAARLGLRWPRLSDLVAAGLALIVLSGLNAGSDWLQHRIFPDSWQLDHRMSEAMASGMKPSQIVLLGFSAGIGEEIIMRGALQPKLGILLTAACFAALHVQYSWFGMLVIFALGIVLGLVRKYASTSAAMIAHGAYDMLAALSP
jgi:membrane protease YdiL (CAAX protease family)